MKMYSMDKAGEAERAHDEDCGHIKELKILGLYEKDGNRIAEISFEEQDDQCPYCVIEMLKREIKSLK